MIIKHNENCILLTGVLRSGSTLACTLLNTLPNTVALDEPFEHRNETFFQTEFTPKLVQEVDTLRQVIIENKKAASLQAGQTIQQHYSNDQSIGKLRERLVTPGTILIKQPLNNDFTLVIKHFAPFLVHLKALSKQFKMYALVRNPLAVLASMHTLASMQDGYPPPHEARLIPHVIETLRPLQNKTERLIKLLSWYFESCLPLLKQNKAIYYEDLVYNQSTVLSLLAPSAIQLQGSLENKNLNEIYNYKTIERLGEALLNSDGCFWEFYSKASVRQLLDRAQQKIYKPLKTNERV